MNILNSENQQLVEKKYTKIKNEIRVLSVDPGYDRLGIAVLSKKPGTKDVLLFSECVETNSKSEFIDRLFNVVESFEKKIEIYSPDFFAVETLFFSSNQKTAMRVAEVRGALLYSAKKAGLKTMEINPMQIKLAVTGDGKSDKSQMTKMIQLILGLNKKAKDDEYDAIATGIAFLSLYRPGYTQLT